jgi:OmpA-OmpF porin, OOP family
MTLKKALLAATILATPVAASAQPVTGLYVGAGAGVNWISNPEKWDISGSAAPGNFGLTNNTTITNAGKANLAPRCLEWVAPHAQVVPALSTEPP